MLKAVVFDLDGTLTDTLQDIAGAMNRSLRLHGLPEYDVPAYRYLVGDGVRVLAQRAVGDRQDLMESVMKEYQAYYSEHSLDVSKPYDGIEAMLDWLQQQGLKLCVFSNKPHADTCRVVAHFFPNVKFDHVRGAMDGVAVKPDPAGAWLAAEALGVKPDECLYLGDTSVDMTCARNAGMHPVGVTWGFREEKELRESGAEIMIHHPRELKEKISL